jgi:hypothetical protein
MQRMRDVLRSSLGRSLRELTPEDRLAAAWQIVCGAALASRGEVLYLDRENFLHVRIADPAWMDEFINRRGALAAELAKVASVALTGIHFEKARAARSKPARTATPRSKSHEI